MNKPPAPPSPSGPPAATPLPVSEITLQAYADGQLDDGSRRQVEAWLASHPEQAAQVADYRRLGAALHERYDPVLDEPVPERFLALLAEAAPPPAAPAPESRSGRGQRLAAWLTGASTGWRPASFAASLAWISLGVIIGWQVRGTPPLPDIPPMVRHAAVAYVTYATEAVHPVEVAASQAPHLEAWLSRRLGIDVKAARLEQVGYALMGGRLLAGTQRPVAQFMYEDKVGRRLTLYVKTQESGHDQSLSFRFAQEADVNAYYWIENGTGYVLSGNLERGELLRVARAVHAQLTRPGPAATPAKAPVSHGKAT